MFTTHTLSQMTLNEKALGLQPTVVFIDDYSVSYFLIVGWSCMKIRADGFNFPQKNYIAAADCSRAAFE